MPLPGFDTNSFHPLRDGAAAKAAGYKFVYIRAAQGTVTDTAWRSSLTAARLAGLRWGAYHALLKTDPAGQARYFHELTQGEGLTPWLDVEVPGLTLAMVEAWLDEYYKLSGRLACIYTRANIWNPLSQVDSVRGQQIAAQHPLSVANYRVSAPALPGDWPKWTFWQYDDRGTVPGVPPPTDLDWFNGTEAELDALGETMPIDLARARQLAAELLAVLNVDAAPPIPPDPPSLYTGKVSAPAGVKVRDGSGQDTGRRLPLGTPVTVWREGSVPGQPGLRAFIVPNSAVVQENVSGQWVEPDGTGGGQPESFSLLWPVRNTPHVITQRFGANPEAYAQFNLPGHEGIDVRAADGAEIVAGAAGVVHAVILPPQPWPADRTAYGNHIRIDHAGGYQSIYAHLKSVAVQVGQWVERGQLIGLADSTGNSTASHLHLTLKLDGHQEPGYPAGILDPEPFLEQ